MDASGNDIVGASGRHRVYNTGEPLDVERANYSGAPLDVELPETAHQISTDSWFQVGFLLTTGMSSAFVMGYSAAVMVPLGWVGGVVGFLAFAAISLYANALIAKLHELGGKRHIRYRDLAGYVYGTRAYYLTWGLQYVNLSMITIGFIILAGSALKAVYVLFTEDNTMKLPYFIAITGFVCASFAISIPHLSALRIWLVFSTFFSLVYVVVVLVLSIRDGIRAPPRDYSIPGSKIRRVFTTIGAFSSIVTAYSAGMIPEMQATIRAPAVPNMMKALYLQFTVGSLPFYAVVFVGYWAFGNGASYYLLNNVSGPVWVKAFANICAFLQSVISLHIFASPMYEYMDTKYGGKGGALAVRNISFRIVARGGYLAFATLIAAMLPFIGDFISLTGAVSIFPLTFILANHMYLVAKRSKLSSLMKNWHWANVWFFGIVAVAATVSAIRLIVVDSNTYSLFADL